MTIDVSGVLKAAILQRRSITEASKNENVQQMVKTAGDKLSQWHTDLIALITTTFDDPKLIETFEEAQKEGFSALVRDSFNNELKKAIKNKMKTKNFFEDSLKKQILSQGSYNFEIGSLEDNIAERLQNDKTRILDNVNKGYKKAQHQLEYSQFSLAPLYEYANNSITQDEFKKKIEMGLNMARAQYCEKNGKKHIYPTETPFLAISFKIDNLEKIKEDFDKISEIKQQSAPKV